MLYSQQLIPLHLKPVRCTRMPFVSDAVIKNTEEVKALLGISEES